MLFSGEEVGEELVARVIKSKLVSPEIQHYGKRRRSKMEEDWCYSCFRLCS